MDKALEIAEEALKNKPFVEESQLDRIEKKMDRILELLEDKELSNSVSVDSKKVPWSYYTPGDIARHYGDSKDN